MRKLLIFVAIAATLPGCSSIDIDKDTWDVFGNVIPRSLEKLPFVYRPLIIQGNLITQDNVNHLKPGMHKKQVQLVMGTALLQDVFHDHRWEYYYGIGIGKIELEKQLTLFFGENDRLQRIVGDYQPLPPIQGEGTPEEGKSVIPVPDWRPPPKTLFEQLMQTVGLSEEEGTAERMRDSETKTEPVEGSADETEENQDNTTPF
jgi:outer membrane protein assembly factor BamE